METLKIAFYTDSYLPLRDGVVTSIINTREELERRGHEVYVFASGNRETAKIAKKDNRLFVIKGIKFNKYPQYTMGLRSSESKEIRSISPDIIHVHTPFSAGLFGYRASSIVDTKLIGTFHTMVFSDEVISSYLTNNPTVVKISKYLMLRYLKWFYSKMDYIISPTNYIKNILIKNGLREVNVIPTGMRFSSLKVIKRDYARKSLKLKKEDKLILYFGRVSREKNVEMLVKAARILDSYGFNIIIAGSGPYLEELSLLNKKLRNKNVRFTGFVKEEDIPLYYCAADMLCNPSRFETQGLVDLYASYYSLPILIPEKTAQAELLKISKCGETFNANSIKSLAENAVKIWKNRETYKFNKIIKNFDIKNTVDKLITLYNQ